MKNNINRKYGQKSPCRAVCDIILFLIIFFSLCQCAPSQPPSSDPSSYKRNVDKKNISECKKKLWVGDWWNYYEEGLCFAEKEYFDEAIASFKEAIRQYKKDEWNTRIDGVSFIDYFPHREMGIAYYYLGNFEKAKEELEISLKDTFTSEAKFYLKRVFKELHKTTKPEINLSLNDCNLWVKDDSGNIKLWTNDSSSAHLELWTKNDSVTFSGDVNDEQHIEEITIRGATVFWGSASERQFKRKVPLSEGRNPINIESKNLMGVSAKKDIDIFLDRQGPTITIEDVSFNNPDKKEIIISGSVNDEGGISYLSVNGKKEFIQGKADFNFSNKKFPFNDADTLDIVTEDIFGNKEYRQIPLKLFFTDNNPPILASLQSDNNLTCQQDDKPKIELSGNFTDFTKRKEPYTAYQKAVNIKGVVTGKNKKIESLKFIVKNNGKESKIPMQYRKAKSIEFNKDVELEIGRNEILINAVDQDDRETSTVPIIIERNTPKIFQVSNSDERLSFSIPIEKTYNDQEKEFVSSLRKKFGEYEIPFDMLTMKLTEKIRRFVLNDSNFNYIIQHLKLTEKDDKSIKIQIEICKAKNKNVENWVDASGFKSDYEALSDEMIKNINWKYPLIDGEIIGIGKEDDDSAFTTSITHENLMNDRELTVFRAEEKNGYPPIADAYISRMLPKPIKAKRTSLRATDISNPNIDPTIDKVITK